MDKTASGSEPVILRGVTVEKVVPGGDGLVRYDGEVLFVPSVLPGEVIDLEITERRKKFSRGICRAVLRKSEHRITPPCPLYDICGGCDLQHTDYGSQLAFKETFLRDLFRRIGKTDLPGELDFAPSPPFAYRQRAQVHSDGRHIGFKAKRGDRIIPVRHCPILVPSLNDYLKRADPSSFTGRKTLFGTEREVYQENDGREITVPVGPHRISFRGDLFFQSNASLLPELIRFALQEYRGETAMDLYCGAGVFSVFLRERFRRIIAIESHPGSEEFYRKNMGPEGYAFHGMSLERWLKRGGAKAAGPIDLIVLDPPRTGLSAPVREFLIRRPVPRLVYVSCDPATQARDTAELLKAGYVMGAVKGFDFYPQTHHMETVIHFRR